MSRYAHKIFLAGLLIILLFWLAGCTAQTSTASPTRILPTAPVTPTPLVPATEPVQTPVRTFTVRETFVPEEMVIEPAKPTSDDPYIAGLVQQARQDLANRLDLSEDQIELLRYEEMIWPDGSLGCPQPGMAYTQVMVDGYRILLQRQGQVYAYHGGGGRPPFLCQDPQQ